MASATEKQNFVSNSAQDCKTLINLYGRLVVDDTLFNGSPSYTTAITQGDLDAVTSFGGLTHQQLVDAEFALSTIKNQITSSLPALLILAGLA